jgi:hypothetical protein
VDVSAELRRLRVLIVAAAFALLAVGVAIGAALARFIG